MDLFKPKEQKRATSQDLEKFLKGKTNEQILRLISDPKLRVAIRKAQQLGGLGQLSPKHQVQLVEAVRQKAAQKK